LEERNGPRREIRYEAKKGPWPKNKLKGEMPPMLMEQSD